MSEIRILHCGKSIENYNLCINQSVAGFTWRFSENPDPTYVYFAVKIGKESYCGARGILGELTDYKPWSDAERYAQSFKVKQMEYCKPFALRPLSEFAPNWGAKFLMGSKLLKSESAREFMETEFNRHKSGIPYRLQIDQLGKPCLKFTQNSMEQLKEFSALIGNDKDKTGSAPSQPEEFKTGSKEESLQQLDPSCDPEDDDEELEGEGDEQSEGSEDQIKIVAAYQTVKFKNEQDSVQGLEKLVTDHFFDLFQHFYESKSILISQNRLFQSQSVRDVNDRLVSGIRGVPDAILLSFDQDNKKAAIRINLIEYECYGEGKSTTTRKNQYFNSHIIPQLIKFASMFSVASDQKMREKPWTTG